MSKFVLLALAFAAVVALSVANNYSSFAASNLKKYHVSNVRMEYSQAYAHCKRYGWALATEHTPEATQAINDALTALGVGAWYFIGGFEVKGGDFYPGWIWLDDGKDFGYTNWWAGNIPTKYECLVKLSVSTYSGQWTSDNCSTPNLFICESELD